jgi:hypothetical protein
VRLNGIWMDAEGNITVDSPGFRTALELYKRLYDAGVTPKDSTTYEYAEANAAFGSGQPRPCCSGTPPGDLDDPEKTLAAGGRSAPLRPDRARWSIHPHPRLGPASTRRVGAREGRCLSEGLAKCPDPPPPANSPALVVS